MKDCKDCKKNKGGFMNCDNKTVMWHKMLNLELVLLCFDYKRKWWKIWVR